MTKKASSLRILAGQIDIPKTRCAADRDAHLARTSAEIEAALRECPRDLVVLPELSSLEYSRQAFDMLYELAEPLDGMSFKVWGAVARRHGCHIAYGFARSDGEGNYFISIGVVDPDGQLVGHYDKIHLAQYGASMEKDYFTRGDHLFTFNVNGFCIAPIICYDIRIPEISRALVIDHGVDLILHCGAYYRDESFATWHDFAMTRAIENQIFFLSLNRAGENWGNSLFCRPWMDETRPAVAFPDHAPALRDIRVERAEIEAARRDYSFLQDRLPAYR